MGSALTKTLYVNGIPAGTAEDELQKHFGRWRIKSVGIPSSYSSKPTRYAFVEFVTREDAESAIKALNGSFFKGVRLRVEFKKPRSHLSSEVPRDASANKPFGTLAQPQVGGVSAPARASTVKTLASALILPAEQDQLVYLCDRNALTVPPSRVLGASQDSNTDESERQIVDDVIRRLVAPLGAYVSWLITYLPEPDPRHSSAGIRQNAERIARFFAFTFYSALFQEGMIDKHVKRHMVGWNTLLQASLGQAMAYADELKPYCAKSRYELVRRGAWWWSYARNLLDEINRFCNRATHLSPEHFKQESLDLQPSLMNAFLQLGTLGWVFVANRGDQRMVILDGPSSEYWQHIDGSVPKDAISLNPFFIFRRSQEMLDCFQEREDKRTYNFIRLGESVQESEIRIVTADTSLIKVIEKNCPVDKWKNEVERWKQFRQWDAESNRTMRDQGYDFADLTREAPPRLYGREVELSGLERLIFGDSRSGGGASLLIGAQGVGKSALMWKFREFAMNQRRTFVWFCFRDDDRRCDINSFFLTAAIQIAKYKGIVPRAESPQGRFEEALAAQGSEPVLLDSIPIVLLDGLDALSLKRAADLSNLLATIESKLGVARWVCSSQPSAELQSWALRNQTRISSHEVRLLGPEATRKFLREELLANASHFSDSDLRHLTSDFWIERIVAKPDAGLPLYIRHVLDSAVARDYRDPDQIPPTLPAAWERALTRLKRDPLAIKLLAVLSVVLRPVESEEIAGIISWPDVDVIEEILNRHPEFVHVETRWSIRYWAFRQYVRESHAPELRLNLKDAIRNLMAWASNWQNCQSRYPFEFLPQHLEEEDHEGLRCLSLNEQFLAAQSERFPDRPDLPLETSYRALRAAVQDNSVANVFVLGLRYSEYVARTSTISTLSTEFYKHNYKHVSQLASRLPEEQEQIIWKLVGVMGALVDGDHKCAEEIVTSISAKERARGSQRKYEFVVAVLLGIVTSTAARVEIDIEGPLCAVAENVLSEFGKAVFFDSLAAFQATNVVASLLPQGQPRRQLAIRALAGALGRQRRLSAMGDLLELSKLSLTSTDEIQFEAARGFSLSGDPQTAIRIASDISSHYLRRAALCSVAADLVASGRNETHIVQALVLAERLWNLTGQDTDTHQEVTTAPTDEVASAIRVLLSSIIQKAESIVECVPAALINAQLGLLQHKIFGDDYLLRRAEEAAQNAGVFARVSVIDAYLRLRRWGDARRLVTVSPVGMRSKLDLHVFTAEIAASSQEVSDCADGQRFSIQRGCDLSSALSRAGNPGEGFKILLGTLPLLHPLKAEQPSKWGRPRVLGEIVGALYSLGEHSLAEKYFQIAYMSLPALTGVRWESDRAFAFLNLAESLLASGNSQLTQNLKERIDNLLHEANRAAKIGLETRPRAALVGILASTWELKMRFDVFCDPNSGPSDALAAARSIRLRALRVPALIEIARIQARLGRADDARETLAEARSISSKGGPLEQAQVLLGSVLCGQIEGVRAAIDNAVNAYRGDARYLVRRAEVELNLQLSEMQKAEKALDGIDDVEVRSHAARDVAIKYADLEDFTKALRLTQQRIGASRSELIPDVAEAIAVHARTVATSRSAAKQALLQFSLETAQYLDGTFRVIGAIINSRAFDLTTEQLNVFAEMLVDEGREPSDQVSAR